MNIFDALTAIAAQTGLDAEPLLQYADDYQGDNERAVLYAIVKVLQPQTCLELGTHLGEGTMCILDAVDPRPATKFITTVDISDSPMIGSKIPRYLRKYVALVRADIDTWIGEAANSNHSYDFIFEDGSHSIHQVQEVYKYIDQLLNPGGIIMSHDAAIEGVGAYVLEGQQKSGYTLPVYQIDPMLNGYTVYRKPLT